VVVVGVTFLVFLLLHCIPGDAVEVMLGEYASSADRAALRSALGLDRPLLEQWLHFAGGVLRLDLGASLYSGRNVVDLVAEHYARTALLAAVALTLALALGIPLGVMAALKSGRGWDTGLSVFAVAGMSVPSFVLGPLLIIVFGVYLRWLPIAGADSPAALVLPATTLALGLSAVLARMTRAALLDQLQQPFVTAARARGLSEMRVIVGHACRNAALPVVTVIGLQLGALLGGAVITEAVFGWPGVGQLAIESIHRRDYPVVQACVLAISLSYVAVNMLTDILYARLDPRIDLQ
jgi:peptide/nickel transport system permease protein